MPSLSKHAIAAHRRAAMALLASAILGLSLVGCAEFADAVGIGLFDAAMSQVDGAWTDDAGFTVTLSHQIDTVTVTRENLPAQQALWNKGSGKVWNSGDVVRISLTLTRNGKAIPTIEGTLVQDPATKLHHTIRWDAGPVWKKKG